MARRRLAALSWLAACLLVLGGFRAWRTYSRQREEAEKAALLAPPLPYTFTDSLGYTKLYQYYPARAPSNHSLRIRRALRWDKVEVKPLFPGGEEALRTAIRRLVRYARGMRISATLAVSCIVEADGHLTLMDVELPEADPAAGLGFEAEAARAVQALPPFVPGRQAGRPVAVARTLTVAILPSSATSAP
jgi:hypothetical protein